MNADKIILGKDCAFSTDTKETGLYNNVIGCGPSGCGKTTSIVEPRLLETFHDNLFVPVTKRRIVDEYRDLLINRGYKVEEMNFVDPLMSTRGFNPLASVKSDLEIYSLARAIVLADHGTRTKTIDPYWDNSSAALLTAEIAMVISKLGRKATFTDVMDYHNLISVDDSVSDNYITEADSDFAAMKKKNPNSLAVSCWNTFRSASSKTAGNILSTLNSTLLTLCVKEIRNFMSANISQFDFKQFAEEKTVLFLVTSPMNSALNTFINLFYTLAFRSLFEYAESCPDGVLPIPVQIICDDFATGCRIDEFAQKISVFGAKRMSVMLMIQSESQLTGLYGEYDATTILNNCDTYVYMGGMDLATCKSISARMNIPLEDVLYMPVGQEFVFRRGSKPIVTTRYNKRENSHYQELFTARRRKKVKDPFSILNFSEKESSRI